MATGKQSEPQPVIEFTDRAKTSFSFASDLIKQLITLSTGLIGVTVTFQKDIVKSEDAFTKSLLVGSWVIFLISVIFGVISMMGLTGVLSSKQREASIQGRDIQLFPALQAIAFAIGTILLIWFGARSI